MMRGLALVVLVTMPLAAQQPHPDHSQHSSSATSSHMEEMMAPMMASMAFKPDRLLARKDSLHLNPQQIARLTSLQDAGKKAHEQCAADAKPHLDAIAEAWRAAAVDTAALQRHFEAAHAAMGKGHWAMLTIAVQARAVLTPEQRARVEHEQRHH